MTRNNSLESDADWLYWGQTDPLWAIATEAGRQRDGVRPWKTDEFCATGESDWQDFRSQWSQYGLDLRHCVDIGCGAGRITGPLALHAQQVSGVDVSPGMLAHARKLVSAKNVEFFLTAGVKLPHSRESTTAVFSAHVLQHLDGPEVILEYFREFWRILEPGGTLMIHLPLYEWPSNGRIARFLQVLLPPLLLMSRTLAWSKRMLRIPTMRMTAVRQQWLSPALSGLDFRDIQFRTFPLSRSGDLHSFVFARKPSRTTVQP